jgi:hypothetical protein
LSREVWRPQDGVQGALELLDGPTEQAVDHVPTADQEVPVASYADWTKEDTRIVTYRISNDLYPGIRVESRDEAIADVKKNHGAILVANYVPGRAFFRVKRGS